MDPALLRKLELSSAQMRQIKASTNRPSASGSVVLEIPAVVPSAPPSLAPAIVGEESSPSVAGTAPLMAEAVVLIRSGEVSTKEPLVGQTLVEERPAEEIKAKDTVDPPEPIKTVEVGDPHEQAVPSLSLPPAISKARPSQLASSSPSAAENLKTVAEFLESILSSGEKQDLNVQGAQRQMTGALKSLARIENLWFLLLPC